MRFGRLYNELTDGKKVYLSTEGQFLCEHGELASNISYWCAMEKKKAKVDGLCPPPRGGHSNPSICTCQTTEGMNVTLAESITPPTRPSSLFEFLETSGTEIIKVKGRDARRVPHTKDAAFVSTVGQVTCRHGASRRSLIKKERSTTESKRLPKCGCSTVLPLLGPWKRRAATPGGTLPLKRMLEPEPPTKFYKEN